MWHAKFNIRWWHARLHVGLEPRTISYHNIVCHHNNSCHHNHLRCLFLVMLVGSQAHYSKQCLGTMEDHMTSISGITSTECIKSIKYIKWMKCIKSMRCTSEQTQLNQRSSSSEHHHNIFTRYANVNMIQVHLNYVVQNCIFAVSSTNVHVHFCKVDMCNTHICNVAYFLYRGNKKRCTLFQWLP